MGEHGTWFDYLNRFDWWVSFNSWADAKLSRGWKLVVFQDTHFTLTHVLITMLVVLFTVWGALAFMKGLRSSDKGMVPPRTMNLRNMFEYLAESLYGFVEGAMGEKNAARFYPIIGALFLFILFANLLGMLPYSFTVTSHIVVTFALAIVAFTGMILIGLFKHGPHFFSMFVPSGVPKLMLPLIAPIEMISFLVRPFSLSIRLAVAMTAGHILLKVIASFIGMLLHAGGWYSLITVFPFAMVVLLVGLEIFIAILQAYVFALLTTMYLNDTLNLHH